MDLKQDIGKACLNCKKSDCKGFSSHQWRSNCGNCKCKLYEHDIREPISHNYFLELEIEDQCLIEKNDFASKLAKELKFEWLPHGINQDNFREFILQIGHANEPRGSEFSETRSRYLRKQIPYQDRKPATTIPRAGRSVEPNAFEAEQREANRFQFSRNKRDLGIGFIKAVLANDGIPCQNCREIVPKSELAVCVKQDHRANSNLTDPIINMESQTIPIWHPKCFTCTTCLEPLVDYVYCWSNGKPYCVRHYGELIRPRCNTCDHLIFSEEYTRAMDVEHHTGHFACKSCDQSLTGQRYILREDEPHCLSCYENKFANTCEQCKQKIGCDSKDLSFKERHWHEKCFKCSACETSLADRPFATRDELLFCSDCYDEKFAARCDGCTKVFKAGMRKYEYRDQQWHEECFICSECKNPIGAKSFIPRENQVVCVPCYEEKFAQKCTKCGKVIRRGGVTYKGNPWHKECFCCNSCNKELAGLKFTSKDEKPYCAECYGDLFAKKCFKCKLPITGFGGCKFISFEERHWHSECFSCSKCSTNLVGRGFLTSEEQILCSECGR